MFSGGDDKEEEEICKKIKSSRKYREFSDFVDLNEKSNPPAMLGRIE